MIFSLKLDSEDFDLEYLLILGCLTESEVDIFQRLAILFSCDPLRYRTKFPEEVLSSVKWSEFFYHMLVLERDWKLRENHRFIFIVFGQYHQSYLLHI